MMCKLFVFIFLFCWSNSFAVGFQGHEEMVMTLRVSKTGFTRIFVPNEKITDVFVYPEGLAEVEINPLGQLIVVPGEVLKELLFVSFITDKQTVQDLSLVFVDKKPEVVKILSPIKEVKKNDKK